MHKVRWMTFVSVVMFVVAAATRPSAFGVIADRPECPHSWSTYFFPAEAGGDAVLGRGGAGRNAYMYLTARSDPSTFLISRGVSDVPEFNDCQRLITNGTSAGAPTRTMKYAEMAAVLVRERLDSVLVARLGDDGGKPIGPNGLPVAEIISEGAYAPLGVQKGFNCLLLADNGIAWMLAMGQDHRKFRCDALALPRAASNKATPLAIVVGPSARAASDVPAVTRWEWDSTAHQQLVGIKCRPNAWCTVGPRGHRAMAAVAMAARAGARVRGGEWYDEQFLADTAPPVAGVTTLRVTSAVGVAYPASDLDSLTFQSAHNTWKNVAYIALSGRIPSYETKLGFAATPNASSGPGGMNAMAFCVGAKSACGVPARVRPCASQPEVWARVTSPTRLSSGTNTTYLCVRYRPASSMPGMNTSYAIPAVVRWRWKPNDETMWVRCPAGCCEVYGDV